jgi:hypothetical protein
MGYIVDVMIGGSRMRKYYIYLIEEEFASHYFGRESIVYNLFQEFERTSLEKKLLLKQQIDFITRSIPTLRIHQLIEKSLRNCHSYCHYRDSHSLQFVKPDSTAKIVLYDHFIKLEATGNYEAETIFFEILRKYDSCYLAMDFDLERYGWLNPIKQRKFI